MNKYIHFTYNQWFINHEKIILFLYDQNIFIQEIYD